MTPARIAPFAPFTIVLVTDRPASVSPLVSAIDPHWGHILVADGATASQATEADLILVDVPPGDPAAMDRALALASRQLGTTVPVLVIGGELASPERIQLYRSGVLAILPQDQHPGELAAQLASVLSGERTAAESLSRLREHTRQLDEQLRLAQRLQMDFLPRRLPQLGGATFGARLEPASWVAGDFYDVFRLDEHHIGFYVADAVGHGIPAALLTVFVKQSLQTKRIEGNRYELIAPDEALRLLNADLLSAELQESPFITMVYGILDARTHQVDYALAGHPKPILLAPGGGFSELDGDGSLLGIFRDAVFQTARCQLSPGERLLLYSDGAERVDPRTQANPEEFRRLVRRFAACPLEEMLDRLLEAVHDATEGEPLADDVTFVAMDLQAQAEPRP